MIKIKKIKEVLKKSAWIIGENASIALVISFFLALILGGFIFYKYGFLVKKSEVQITEEPLRFKDAVYQRIFQEWQIRQQRFEEADLKEYLNLFSLSIFIPEVSIPEETPELTE